MSTVGGTSSSSPTSGNNGVSRIESMAYPKASNGTIMISKLQWYIRQNHRAVLATIGFLAFVMLISSDMFHDSSLGPSTNLRRSSSLVGGANFGGAAHRGYFSVADSVVSDTTYRFAAVTDLDQLSAVEGAHKPTFRSYMTSGTITRKTVNNKQVYTIDFQDTEPRHLETKHNEAGRGAEFSELTVYQDRLLTFDDRTGDVFEILNTVDGNDSFVVPRFVLTEGVGDTDKGMKWEWATVKGHELYMGSMGKEFTNPDGSVANTNNLWVAILDPFGQIRRVDWTRQFNFVRAALDCKHPGYVLHEAVNWSPALKKWVFLPRRVSQEPYDDVKDEKRGSNKVVLVDENFTNAQVVTVPMQNDDGLHGFSSFAFVPNTNDRHVLATRSVEEHCAGDLDQCRQRSYVVIFDVLTGEVLMDEVKFSEDKKYEGIEFVNVHTKPIYKKMSS